MRTIYGSSGNWLTLFARLGFAARGLVYLLIGVFAIDVAFDGGQPSDNQGVLGTLADAPSGRLLLGLCAVGFAGYAFWRLTETILDPEMRSRELKGKLERFGYGLSGIVHAGLAVTAARLALRKAPASRGSPGDEAAQSWSGWLLEQPAGLLLVGLVALALIAVAVAQGVKAYQANFEELNGDVPAPRQVRWIGRAGYAARALVFAMIAWFLINVLLNRDPQEAGGLGAALRELRARDHGQLLLLIVATGLSLFGIFSFVEARYRRLKVATPNL